jgi:predicted Zn-dependent peptidase
MSEIFCRPLACGATLIVEPMAGVASAGLTWLIPAGCATDPAGREGLSTMLAEMLLRPSLAESAVEPVRDLSLQAIESLADDPSQRAAIAARARHYPPPLNRSTLGTVDGLSAVTHDDLVRGWAARGRPGGSIIALAGAVDPGRVEARFNQLLAPWRGVADEVRTRGEAPRGYGHEEDASNQVQIIILHDAPREADAASMTERLVIDVLSGGMSGRLFTEVRENRGLCYSVSASYAPERDYGRVAAYVGTTPERAQQSLDVLWSELQRINSPPGVVTADEFQRAVVRMKSRLVFSGESTSARASALAADQHRLGRPRPLEELEKAIDALTLDAVNRYLRSRATGRVTIQTLGPAPLKPPA